MTYIFIFNFCLNLVSYCHILYMKNDQCSQALATELIIFSRMYSFMSEYNFGSECQFLQVSAIKFNAASMVSSIS